MKTITIKGFIHWKKPQWAGDAEFTFNQHDYTKVDDSWGYVMVQPHEFTVEIPADFNPIPGLVSQLEAEKRLLKAKFAKDLMCIEDSISKLTCISMDEVTA